MINFSIIIPHFNSLDTLSRTINSIPMREDTEVLVVDNSTVPIRMEHVKSLNRSFTLLYSDNTKGAGHARNVGLDNAKGKWIIFADADDYFTEKFNDILNKYLDSAWDVVMFPIKTVDSTTLLPNNRTEFFNNAIFDDSIDERRKLSINITPWSKLIRHGLIIDHDIRHSETQVSNDVIFNAYIAVHSKKILIDTTSIIYVLTYKPGSLATKRDEAIMYIRTSIDIERNNIYSKFGYKEWTTGFFPYNMIANCNSLKWFYKYIVLLLRNNLIFNGRTTEIKDKIVFLACILYRILRSIKNETYINM